MLYLSLSRRSFPASRRLLVQASLMFAAVAGAAGCSETVESTDIRTTGIYPEITVSAIGNGQSRVEVQLKVGGDDSNTYLELKGEDELTATVEGTTKVLDGDSDERYSASFPVDAEGTMFVISFLRGKADESAPASTVALPAPFDFEVMPTEASRATDDLALSWSPAGSGNLDWSAEGSCIKLANDDTPDDGSQVLPVGTIDTFESDKDKSCTVGLELIRSQSGTIDPAFTEGGRIVARQIRRASFTSNP